MKLLTSRLVGLGVLLALFAGNPLFAERTFAQRQRIVRAVDLLHGIVGDTGESTSVRLSAALALGDLATSLDLGTTPALPGDILAKLESSAAIARRVVLDNRADETNYRSALRVLRAIGPYVGHGLAESAVERIDSSERRDEARAAIEYIRRIEHGLSRFRVR